MCKSILLKVKYTNLAKSVAGIDQGFSWKTAIFGTECENATSTPEFAT